MRTFQQWVESVDPSAFIQQITQSPNDVINYFALADWLEENRHQAAEAVRLIGQQIQQGMAPFQVLMYLDNQARRPQFNQLLNLCRQYPALGVALTAGQITPDDLHIIDGHVNGFGDINITDVQGQGQQFVITGELDVDISYYGPGASAECTFTITVDTNLHIVDYDVNVPEEWTQPDDDDGDDGYDDAGVIDAQEIDLDLSNAIQQRLDRLIAVRRMFNGE